MKFKDMSTEMTEQEIITALYMICPDSLYKRYKREKGYISVWYSLPNDTETDKHHLELLPDRKQLINRIETVLEDNDTKIQDLKQEIKDIQSFDVSDTMEEATKLDRLATNRMYELMISFNGNSNSTKRKLGNIILNKNGLDRISATALSRLCVIPAYADFFKPSYKEIIAEAMKSDAQKTYERNSQPVIEEKNRAIGKTYISNFLLRKALSMAVSSDEVTNNE